MALDFEEKCWNTDPILIHPVGLIMREYVTKRMESNLPKRLWKYCSHKHQCSICKLEKWKGHKLDKINDWILHKDELGLSYRTIRNKIEKELGLDFCLATIHKHAKYLKKESKKSLILTKERKRMKDIDELARTK